MGIKTRRKIELGFGVSIEYDSGTGDLKIVRGSTDQLGLSLSETVATKDTNGNLGAVKTTALSIGATGSETEVTATAAELNILDGVTAVADELNYLDIAALGTGAASKAVVLDASSNYTSPGAGVWTVASGATINVAGTLQIAGVAVSASAAELNKLDGVTATTTEINKLAGAGAILASGTQAANIADASTTHALNATFSDTEVEAALDALGTKINAIIAAIEAFQISSAT